MSAEEGPAALVIPSDPAPVSAPGESKRRPCSHFAQGKCRFGDQCRFSHAQASAGTGSPRTPNNNNHNNNNNNRNRGHHFGRHVTYPHPHHPMQPQSVYFPTHPYVNMNMNMNMNMNVNAHPPMVAHTFATGAVLNPPHMPPLPHNLPLLLNVDCLTSQHAHTTPHSTESAPVSPSFLPPHVLVNIPPHLSVFAIDVECVATGTQHNCRSVAQVALCDAWGRPIYNAFIKQDKPVASHLTELTGITKELLDQSGVPLAEALVALRSFLTPQSVLVGHTIEKDVQWLQLIQGVDYHSHIDLALLYRVYNLKHASFTFFSQDHIAHVCLSPPSPAPASSQAHINNNSAPNSDSPTDYTATNTATTPEEPARRQHSALADAQVSMVLFNLYALSLQHDVPRLRDVQRRLIVTPRVKSFSALFPELDGCCMGNRKTCKCGAPFE